MNTQLPLIDDFFHGSFAGTEGEAIEGIFNISAPGGFDPSRETAQVSLRCYISGQCAVSLAQR